MNQLDDLADRLTSRLRVDPELQMEVAHELRAHLEDSAAEFRRAGASDDDAITSADKAMGDEAEVAQQLWQANRRRVRVRKTVKWAAGVTLMPAAIAVSATVAWSAILSVAVLLAAVDFLSDGHFSSPSLFRHIADNVQNAQLDAIPPAQRPVFNSQSSDRQSTIPVIRQLAEQHTADPVYWANYANTALLELPNDQWKDPKQLATILKILDHGKQIEPGNAFYPVVKAQLLFSASTKVIPAKPDDPAPGFGYVGSEGRPAAFEGTRYEVLSRSGVNQAVAELREAAGKPYLNSHAAELLDRRLALLPPATRVSDQVIRMRSEYSVVLPYLNLYRRAEFIADEAIGGGRMEEATAILNDGRRVALLAAAGSRFRIDLLVASGMYASTLGDRAWIDKQLGQEEQFKKSVAELQQYEKQVYDIRRQSQKNGTLANEQFLHGGVISSDSLPDIGDDGAARRADYAIFDRAALALLLVVLTFLAAAPMARAVLPRLRTGAWPAVAFMGWRRLAAVVVISALVPIGLFVVYTHLTPLGERGYGMQPSYDRVAVEYGLVLALVVVMLRVLSTIALRQRGREIGSEQLQSLKFDRLNVTVGAGLAVLSVVYLFVWHFRAHALFTVTGADASHWSSPRRLWGVALAAAVVIYAIYGGGVATALAQTAHPTRPQGIRPAIWWAAAVMVLTVLGTSLIAVTGNGADFFPRSLVRWLDQYLPYLAAVIAIGVLVALSYILFRQYARSTPIAPHRHNFCLRLSMVPAVVFTAFMVALVADPSLRLQERRAVAKMTTTHAGYDFAHELENSPWHKLQEHLAAMLSANEITREGRTELDRRTGEWREFSTAINMVLDGGGAQ